MAERDIWFETVEEAQAACDRITKLLDMNWTCVVQIVSTDHMTASVDEGAIGLCETVPGHATSRISLLNKADTQSRFESPSTCFALSRFRRDHLSVLTHEVLHAFFHENGMGSGEELAVNKLTEALLSEVDLW